MPDDPLLALRNQRLELLGELVVGIAHDLRNVLGVILAATEVLRPALAGSDNERVLDAVLSSTGRADLMLRQMLLFGRGGDTSEQHRVSADYLLTSIGTLLRGTFPSNIRLLIRTTAGTAEICCDETQVNQALLNLCVNARDAMPGGGELVISAQNVKLRNPAGDYVCITVKDTGTGIPSEVLPNIFEPFFTTKGSKGTGLGLALVKQIIQAHSGLIEVDSGHEGSQFHIYLPVAKNPNDLSEEKFDGKGKTVLVVDDEEFLRQWIKLSLENANYRVLDAGSGAEAMNLFIGNLENVVLLLTDLSIPLMNGEQLAKALLLLRPTLPILYITGLEDSGGTYDPMPAAVLKKPFGSISLLRTLKKVIDSGQSKP